MNVTGGVALIDADDDAALRRAPMRGCFADRAQAPALAHRPLRQVRSLVECLRHCAAQRLRYAGSVLSFVDLPIETFD